MGCIDYLPFLFLSVVFIKIYNIMACDEMSSVAVKLFISLLTKESLNLFITVWWDMCSHHRLQIIMIAIIIHFVFSGFLWFGGFCITLRGNYFHCVGI